MVGWWYEAPSRPLWRHCNGLDELVLKKRSPCGHEGLQYIPRKSWLISVSSQQIKKEWVFICEPKCVCIQITWSDWYCRHKMSIWKSWLLIINKSSMLGSKWTRVLKTCSGVAQHLVRTWHNSFPISVFSMKTFKALYLSLNAMLFLHILILSAKHTTAGK